MDTHISWIPKSPFGNFHAVPREPDVVPQYIYKYLEHIILIFELLAHVGLGTYYVNG
jgi:hypothetical protein